MMLPLETSLFIMPRIFSHDQPSFDVDDRETSPYEEVVELFLFTFG